MKGYVRWSLVLIVVVQSIMVLGLHDYRDPKRHFLTWDAYGYYMYLPGAFIYGDLDRFDYVDKQAETYFISPDIYQLREVNGKNVPSYTMGLAWLWLPFFGLAHGFALLGGVYPADGLSLPYQVAIALSSVVYLWLGMWCLGRWLRRYVGDFTAACTLLVLYLGTNLFYYAVYAAGLTHVYLFALYGVLLWLTVEWVARPTYLRAAGLGAVFALMCLSRPTEVVAFLLPLGYCLWSVEHRKVLLGHWAHVGLAMVAGLVFVFPQLLLWKRQTGHWVFNAYTHVGWGFDWLEPHLLEKIFGYEKGWLLYSPLMALAVLGLVLLWRVARDWQVAISAFFVVNLYLLCAYNQWGVDTSFGMRYVVESYAPLALPLAAFLDWSWTKKGFKWLVGLLVLLGIGLSLFQVWQLRQGILPTDNVNKAFYEAIFLKTRKDRMDLRYLDLKERMPNRFQQTGQTLAAYAWPTDSLGAMNGLVRLVNGLPAQALPAGSEAFSRNVEWTVDAERADRMKGKWVTLRAKVLTPTDRFGHYDASQLVFTHVRPGQDKPLQWVGVRFQRSIPMGEWTDFSFDVRLSSDVQAGDRLTGGLWSSNCPDTVYVAEVGLLGR